MDKERNCCVGHNERNGSCGCGGNKADTEDSLRKDNKDSHRGCGCGGHDRHGEGRGCGCGNTGESSDR